MLIKLSRRIGICQSVAKVYLTGVVPMRALSHRFKFIFILINYLWRRRRLCGNSTEAKEGEAPDGPTISANLWDQIGPKWREIEMSEKCWKIS